MNYAEIFLRMSCVALYATRNSCYNDPNCIEQFTPLFVVLRDHVRDIVELEVVDALRQL